METCGRVQAWPAPSLQADVSCRIILCPRRHGGGAGPGSLGRSDVDLASGQGCETPGRGVGALEGSFSGESVGYEGDDVSSTLGRAVSVCQGKCAAGRLQSQLGDPSLRIKGRC